MKSPSLSAKIVVLATAATALMGCGGKPVVGVLLPTSGAAATYGDSMKSGIELAISHGLADGSLSPSVEFVWADTGTDPTSCEGSELLAGGLTAGFGALSATDVGVHALYPSGSTSGVAPD